MWMRSIVTVVAVVALLTSCGVGTTSDTAAGARSSGPGAGSTGPLAEPEPSSAELCPDSLPRASKATYGFGDDGPAATAPSLPVPHRAWICRYDPRDIATRADAAWFEWVRQGRPRPLDDTELATFSSAVEGLRPASADRACTADLGPRYLVAYAEGSELTGVVVDAYGCGDIRLTDDPSATVPGEPRRPGTVAGVLQGPVGFLGALDAGRGG